MAVTSVGEKNFQNDILDYNGYVLVDFWAEWCMPCKRLSPILDAVSDQTPNVKFAKVNIDENPDLASSYSIRTIPTLVLIKDGKVVQTKNGGAPLAELKEWLATNTVDGA